MITPRLCPFRPNAAAAEEKKYRELKSRILGAENGDSRRSSSSAVTLGLPRPEASHLLPRSEWAKSPLSPGWDQCERRNGIPPRDDAG
ncbi:hypothetical protein B7463_g9227, partial [Scytalidium lignicola]